MPHRTSTFQISWLQELGATLKLAWPLIISQLASIFLFTTDVVMMGWLGPQHLAAGSLGTAFLHPLFVGCIGLISATAPMIAQAIGARESKSVRRTVRQGFWAAALLTVIITPLVLNAEAVYLLLGQEPAIAAMAQGYLNTAVGVVLPGLGFITLRSLLQARGSAQIVLWIAISGIFVNALGNYALMFGNFGFPRLELVGAGLSTTLVNFFMFGSALLFVLMHRRYRRYHILVRLWKPDWHRFRAIFRIGMPIGLSVMAEVGLFGAAVFMMGWLGTNEVAAHAVALQCTAIAFMIPMGLSQATTVRVGLSVGGRNSHGIYKAGWTSLGITLGIMSATSMLFLFAPLPIVTLFLDPALAINEMPVKLAVSYLLIAALFQLVDGTQVVMAAALRGMNDTTIPMVVAIIGYWVVGLSVAYLCGFTFGLRGQGIWIGLASGLAFNAVLLTYRFARREHLGLIDKAYASRAR